MENLPQDIIFDILSRIPVKSVGRFRCVCKSWCCLISKPEFVKTHLKRAITDDVSVGCQRVLIPDYPLKSIDYEALHQLNKKKLRKARQKNGGNACTVIEIPRSPPKPHARLIGSCHGMVGMEVDRDKIVICNPCTREFRVLPKPSSINFKCTIHGGLGYDSTVDDYKFVITACDDDDDDDNDSDGEFKAEVFSLRSNSWRIVHDIPPDILYFYGFGPGVFLNGALHWLAIYETSQRIISQIISFDLATEKIWEQLPFPSFQGNQEISSYDYSNLILLGGCLSVSDSSYSKTDVWVMKEYGVEASWTKLFTLNIRFYEPRCHCLKPLCFSKHGELLVNVDNHIIIYNPKKQTYRKLYEGSWWLSEVIVYIESLVSPNGNGENNDHNIKQQPMKRRQRRLGMKLENS